MNNYSNPDAPTPNQGGFMRYTNAYARQSVPGEMGYVYNGQAVDPFNPGMPQMTQVPGMQPDGLRNQQVLPQPGQLFGQMPQPQQAGLPTGVFPPTSPTPGALPGSIPTNPGFNQLAEGLRNQHVSAPSIGQTPWAQQPAAQPGMVPPMQPQMPQAYTAPMAQPAQMNFSMYGNPSAAMQGIQVPTFDRRAQNWNNPYTNPQPIPPPAVEWNQPTQQAYQPTYMNQPSPIPPVQANLFELAQQNFAAQV